jgi:hypothetical protein
MLRKLAAVTLTLSLAAPLTASAVAITYQIKFTVLSGSVVTQTFPTSGPPVVQVEDAVGRVYFGSFAVDDAILSTDGIGKSGDLDFFSIQMEDNIWGYGVAGNNSFVGFRGPIPGSPCMGTSCLGAPSPGFDVVNGTLTNLRGAVYGAADVPFVDFSNVGGANHFNALGLSIFAPGTSFSHVGDGQELFGGTMEINRIPEPGTLSLFAFGLIALTFTIRRAGKSKQA